MNNPNAIELLKKEFEIKMQKISPDGLGYKIFVESADYKE